MGVRMLEPQSLASHPVSMAIKYSEMLLFRRSPPGMPFNRSSVQLLAEVVGAVTQPCLKPRGTRKV